MVSIDCEMTGIDVALCSIISIGVVDLNDPTRRLYLEMHPFPGALLQEEGLAVCGYTEESLAKIEMTQKEGLEILKKFLDESAERTVVGQNIANDILFLNRAFEREGIDCKIPYRAFDLHSAVCAKLLLQKLPIPMEERKSSLNLDALLNMSGIPEEPRPHNALTGALSHAEVYFRLIEGKSVLPEFSSFENKPIAPTVVVGSTL